MGQPSHLIVAFDTHGSNRQRRSFEASEAALDMGLVPIVPHGLLQGQALGWCIGGVGPPAQRGDEMADRPFIALDRGDLRAHPLTHLLWAVRSASSASHELELLLDLPFK